MRGTGQRLRLSLNSSPAPHPADAPGPGQRPAPFQLQRVDRDVPTVISPVKHRAVPARSASPCPASKPTGPVSETAAPPPDESDRSPMLRPRTQRPPASPCEAIPRNYHHAQTGSRAPSLNASNVQAHLSRSGLQLKVDMISRFIGRIRERLAC